MAQELLGEHVCINFNIFEMKNTIIKQIAIGFYRLGTRQNPVFLLQNNTHWVLIEGGLSSDAKVVLSQLNKLKISLESIQHWLISHSHFDHCGLLMELAPLMPNLQIHASDDTILAFQNKKYQDFLVKINQQINENEPLKKYFTLENIHFKSFKAGEILHLGELIFETHPAKGHSSCMVAFYEKKSATLFVSDALGEYMNDKTFFPLAFDDFDQYISTIKNLKKLAAQTVVLGHQAVLKDHDAQKCFDDALKGINIFLNKIKSSKQSIQEKATEWTHFLKKNTITFLPEKLLFKSILKLIENGLSAQKSVPQYDAVIVGGGIAGLVTALGLGRKGKKILILEKGSTINTSGADVLKPTGIKILTELGCLDELLKAEAQKRYEVDFFHNATLAVNVDYRQANELGHFYLLPYQEVVRVVLEAVQSMDNIYFEFNTALTGIEQDENGTIISAELNHNAFVYAPVFIGADGINSKLRQLLGVSADIQYYQQSMFFNKYPMVSSVLEKNRLYVDSQGAMAYFYPISNTHFRAILSFPKSEAADFLLQKDSNQLVQRIQQMVSHSADVLEHITSLDTFVTFPLCRMNLSQYHYNNAVFLGNSAHAIHPISGQGMNLAIEDADELINQLDLYFKHKKTLEKALSTFTNIRHPFSESVANYADNLSKSFHSKQTFKACLMPKIQTSGRDKIDLEQINNTQTK